MSIFNHMVKTLWHYSFVPNVLPEALDVRVQHDGMGTQPSSLKPFANTQAVRHPLSSRSPPLKPCRRQWRCDAHIFQYLSLNICRGSPLLLAVTVLDVIVGFPLFGFPLWERNTNRVSRKSRKSGSHQTPQRSPGSMPQNKPKEVSHKSNPGRARSTQQGPGI